MKLAHQAAALLLVIAVAGCAAKAPPPPVAPPRDPADTCQAAPGQGFIGLKADALNGAALMRATSTREIRWVGPNGVVTMEYKFGRLTVGHDAGLIIRSVTCG